MSQQLASVSPNSADATNLQKDIVPVTVLIAAKNEAANITRCISALTPAARVILVDSASQDGTDRIARELGAEVVQFKFNGEYPKKRQWALDNLDFETDWILLLDADEVVTDVLWDEIRSVLSDNPKHSGFLIEKSFHFLGKRFRFGGFSHSAVLLIRKGKCRFEKTASSLASQLDMEVHERVLVDGSVGRLNSSLIHQDFKGLHAYIDRHNRYSTWEAELRHQFFSSGRFGEESIRASLFGDAQQRRRFLKLVSMRLPGEPWMWFCYHFFFRLGFLHGRAGLIASQIRASYIRDTRAKVYERTLHQAE